MKIKTLKFFLLPLLVFISFEFVNNYKTSCNANSIKPVIHGSYDSFVNNSNNNGGYKEPNDVRNASIYKSYADFIQRYPNNNSSATVHVQTANDFLECIGYVPGGGAVSKNRNDIAKNIHKIILDNNISLSDANDYSGFANNKDSLNFCGGNGDFGTWLTINHENMVVDGNGNTLDMMFNDIALDSSLSGNNWTWENMKLMGSSYWGPLSVNAASTINYINIDYYGSQLLWSARTPKVKTNIYGNVGVHSLYTYKPLDGNGYNYSDGNGNNRSGYLCESYGNQQNMQSGDLEFKPNSRYYGESYNGNCLELYGESTVDDDAHIEVHPHGTSAENVPWFTNVGSIGLYLNNDNSNGYHSNLTFHSNDKLYIYCDSNNIDDSDGSSYSPLNPSQVAVGVYAKSKTKVYLKDGYNSHFLVKGIGSIGQNYSSVPIVNVNSMSAVVSGKGNEFDIDSDANNIYVPHNGVLNTRNSNILVNNGASFRMNIRNIPQSNTNNYLLYSPNSVINVDRPKELRLSNDTYNSNQSNYLNYMNTNNKSTLNYMRFKNSSISTNNFNGSYRNPSALSFNNILEKDILLPLFANRIYVPGVRLFGSYFNLSKIASGLSGTIDNNFTTQNFDTIDVKGTPVPRINDLSTLHTDMLHSRISGKVVDEYNKPISNAYLKLKISGDKNFSRLDNPHSFYQQNNYLDYINSYEIAYNSSRNYMPDNLGTDSNNLVNLNSPNFYSSLSGSTVNNINYPIIRPDLKSKYFGDANSYFYSNFDSGIYNQFNSGTTIYNKGGGLLNHDPYVAITDSKGRFHFEVPKNVFDNIKNKDNNELKIIPSYNFTDGSTANVKINYMPHIIIKNTIDNTSYKKFNNNDSLSKVFQGGQGRDNVGDTLEFRSHIANTYYKSNIIKAVYKQPVPKSIDEKSLQISYDQGKTYNKLLPDDYTVTQNNNETKNINVNNVSIDSQHDKYIIIRGTMINSRNSINNRTIHFSPSLTYSNVDVSGQENTIAFTDNQLKFQPNDIDYGSQPIIKDELLTPKDSNAALISNIQDDRREDDSVGIFVQQTSDKFYEQSGNNYFRGNLVYNNNSLSTPTSIFNYSSKNSDVNLGDNPIYLQPKQDYSQKGDYSAKLNWTVNYGVH